METSIQEHENNLFAQIRRDKGRLDVAFANAGIAEPAPIGKVTEEPFDRMLDINVDRRRDRT